MDRRLLIAAAAVMMLAASRDAGGGEAGGADSTRQAKTPPNFIVVLIDDMGWGDLSCFGNRRVETQHIDRLAREGVRFSQFYVNSPICSPSRTAITTGRYPQRHRIGSYLDSRAINRARGVADWLDPRAPTLPRMLHGAGYATGHFGKWHMGGQRDVGDAPLISEYGFDASLTSMEGLGDRVLAMLDAHDGTPAKPFALGSDRLGRGAIQWQPRERVTARYVGAAIEFMETAAERRQPFYVNVWPDDVHSPFFPPADRRGDGSKRALYRGVLDAMDEQLGELFDWVQAHRSVRDNTIIVLCSDNGPEPGAGRTGGLRGHKALLYEGGVRSPLVVWGPGVVAAGAAGTWNRETVLAEFDLPPSLLAIAGVAAPAEADFDGGNHQRQLLGFDQASDERTLFFRRPPDRDEYGDQRDAPDLAVRRGKWKLLCEYDGSQAELYDLEADRREKNNLASSDPARVAELTRQVRAWHAGLPPDKGATYVRPAPPPGQRQPL